MYLLTNKPTKPNLVLFFHRLYEELAVGVLDECYHSDRKLTSLIIVRRLEKWGSATCLDLANSASNMKFIAHPAVQNMLKEFWMGSLSLSNPRWKVCINGSNYRKLLEHFLDPLHIWHGSYHVDMFIRMNSLLCMYVCDIMNIVHLFWILFSSSGVGLHGIPTSVTLHTSEAQRRGDRSTSRQGMPNINFVCLRNFLSTKRHIMRFTSEGALYHQFCLMHSDCLVIMIVFQTIKLNDPPSYSAIWALIT